MVREQQPRQETSKTVESDAETEMHRETSAFGAQQVEIQTDSAEFRPGRSWSAGRFSLLPLWLATQPFFTWGQWQCSRPSHSNSARTGNISLTMWQSLCRRWIAPVRRFSSDQSPGEITPGFAGLTAGLPNRRGRGRPRRIVEHAELIEPVKNIADFLGSSEPASGPLVPPMKRKYTRRAPRRAAASSLGCEARAALTATDALPAPVAQPSASGNHGRQLTADISGATAAAEALEVISWASESAAAAIRGSATGSHTASDGTASAAAVREVRQREYYQRNRERILQVNANWRLRNKERLTALVQEWRSRNPESVTVSNRKYQDKRRLQEFIEQIEEEAMKSLDAEVDPEDAFALATLPPDLDEALRRVSLEEQNEPAVLSAAAHVIRSRTFSNRRRLADDASLVAVRGSTYQIRPLLNTAEETWFSNCWARLTEGVRRRRLKDMAIYKELYAKVDSVVMETPPPPKPNSWSPVDTFAGFQDSLEPEPGPAPKE